MTETITKKKKKIDYELLRKLEDEYDEAVEDAERKERHLIERVHSEYMKADNKASFFENLSKSDSWYYEKFADYDLKRERDFQNTGNMQKAHQKRKVQSVVDDLEEMEQEIPILEVSDELKNDTDYVDPAEERREWVERTKEELLSEEPKTITEDSNFGKYQVTKSMLTKARDVSKFDFDVSDNYKKILVHQLKKTIDYLNKLLREIE
jgi:hypothetical protein